MVWNASTISRAEQLKLYFFLSAFAVNILLGVIIIADRLSIHYLLYATPMTIQIELLPPLWNELVWIGSLYVVYITKEAVGKLSKFRQVRSFLNVALVGSFFLVLSMFLDALVANVEPVQFPLDLLISVALSLVFAGSLLSFLAIIFANGDIRRLVLIYLLSLLVPIEIWSLAHWFAYPFDVILYSGFAWKGAFIELQLFYLSYPLILWLTIVFLFSWVWVPLVRFVKKRIEQKIGSSTKKPLFSLRKNDISYGVIREDPTDREVDTNRKRLVKLSIPLAALLISLFLGIFVAYYPYLSSKPGFVGNDTLGYFVSLTEMASKDPSAVLQSIVMKEKPLYFLLLYCLWSLSQLPPNVIIEFMPILTIVANALALFWFVKIGEKNLLVAAMAAVFSIFSFTTTISMHAGTLANWLAIALGFIMFGLVLKLQEKVSFKLLLVAILTSASVILIHHWSGFFFLLVLACYLFLTLWEKRILSTRFAVALALAASAIFLVILSGGLASQVFGLFGISYGSEGMGPTMVLSAFWARLPTFIDTWFFGAMANPVMIGFGLIGIVLCFQQRTDFGRLLISWVIVGSLLSVLLSPIGIAMNLWLFWRALYLIPFQILAAIGIQFVGTRLGTARHVENRVQSRQSDVRVGKPSTSLLDTGRLIVVFALVIGYTFTAFLLTIDFPVVPALLLFTFPVVTFIVHFRIRKRPDNTVIVFMFAMLVTLILFNYTLRTLAPLSVHRLQP